MEQNFCELRSGTADATRKARREAEKTNKYNYQPGWKHATIHASEQRGWWGGRVAGGVGGEGREQGERGGPQGKARRGEERHAILRLIFL